MPPRIYFFKEDIKFRLNKSAQIESWVKAVIKKEGSKPGDINFIFCSDKFLLDINRRFLNHDYFTDIITFDESESGLTSGEIYISIDRVKDNAQTLNAQFHVELKRVIIHGVLHLLGYKDSTKAQKKEMRLKEDTYLSLLLKSTGN